MAQPIVVCEPFLKPHPKHMDHFIEWYAANKHKHNLRRLALYFRALHQAQQAALNFAYAVDASHILFTEDDQWGYPIDGLDVLLEAGKDVIGFRTYKRSYPYLNMCMRKERPDFSMIAGHAEMIAAGARLLPFGRGTGPEIQKTDLISWAFTLVKMPVFDKMRAAGKHPFRQWGPHPTDSFFCQYCEDLGIDRWVHFGYTIGHGDVAPEDIYMARRLEEARRARGDGKAGAEKVSMVDDWGNAYGPDVDHVPEVARAKRLFDKQVAVEMRKRKEGI